MKFLLTLFVPLAAAVAGSQTPSVPECFKVHSLIRMDEEHYWANWTNACPYTIDSVYVMVKFAGRSMAQMVDGVWALHFITPGTHQVMRLSTPMGVPDFESVRVSKITVDSAEALHVEPRQYRAVRDADLVADPGPKPPPQPDVARPRLVPDAAVPVVVLEAAAPPPSVRPPDAVSAKENNRLGRELLLHKNYREAIEHLSEAIRQKPDFALAYNARGFAHYLLREYSQALADLDEAIRLNPRYLNAYQNRSRARKAVGDSLGSLADQKTAHTLAKVSAD